MLICSLSIASAGFSGDNDYVITNPYADVVWGEWNAYKAQLHCHSNVSDGNVPLNEVIEAHYALGFDILAITDHAVVGKPWNETPEDIPLFRLVKYERTEMAEITPLTDERYAEIKSGVGRDGRAMLDVDRGIEMNGAVPSNSHINGYFCGYGQGLLGVDGDYETPASEVDKLGGISFIDHIGNYTRTQIDNNPAASDDIDNINKFANIFLTWKSCVGMDINSGRDTHTKYDRVLYDNVLQTTIPNGETPWCFAFSDAHEQGQWDRAFTVHMMTELTNTELRRSMETGTFFAVSRSARYELGDDFYGETAEYPMVTNVIVDDADDTITLMCENCDNVTWVADGKIIETGSTIDLDDHADEISCYVRAYLTGDGGICYVQPFAVKISGIEPTASSVPDTHDTSTFLRAFVTILDELIFKNSTIVALFKQFALGFD